MKDPLQTVKTPYELLGLEPGVSDPKAIRNARVFALQRKAGSPADLKLAMDSLLDPVARREHELLQYNPQVFERLGPSPFTDPSILEPANRAATSAAWQGYVNKNCSDIWAVHALAILWYWWTFHEEDLFTRKLSGEPEGAFLSNGRVGPEIHLDERAKSDLNELHRKWLSLIACWSVPASTPRFWSELPDVTESQTAVLQEKFAARLQDRLRELDQRYSDSSNGSGGTGNASAGALAEHYHSLRHHLATELATAREVGETSILVHRGQVCYAGPLFLKQMNRLTMVRERVKEKLERRPESERLRQLRRLLSPYRWYETLIEENKPQAALDELRKLPDAERHTVEVGRLRSRAHQILGNQEAELGKVEQALVHYGLALQYPHGSEAARQIQEEVVSLCLPAANKLEEKQREKAITILEEGLKIVKEDEKLQAALANLLTRRGFETIDGVLKSLGNESPTAILNRIEEINKECAPGLADLERAETLGSKDAARIASQAREAIKDLEASQYYNRGVETINQAQEKALREKKGFTNEFKAAVRKGLRDLEKAAALGSEKAAEQAKVARELLEHADGGLIHPGTGSAPPGWVRKANEAGQAAAVGNWDLAIKLLREAIQEGGRAAPDELRKNLATCLVNRGVQRANQTVENMQNNTPERRAKQFFDFLEQNRHGDDCAMCNKSKYSSRGDSWYGVNLPQGGTASLCPDCKELLEKLLTAPAGPSEAMIAELYEAESELKEALELDPGSEYARENLSRLQDLTRGLPKPSPTRRASGSSPAKSGTASMPKWLSSAISAIAAAVLYVLIPSFVGFLFASSAADGQKAGAFAAGFGFTFVIYQILGWLFGKFSK